MYFHNGDNQSKTIFNKNECLYEEVYVSELNDGNYLTSEIPYFFSASNGHLSISDQMKTFAHYDSEHNLIEVIELTFITECQTNVIVSEEQGSEPTFIHTMALSLLLVIILSLIIYRQRRQKNAKNRFHR